VTWMLFRRPVVYSLNFSLDPRLYQPG
jgi:hypothetical protein